MASVETNTQTATQETSTEPVVQNQEPEKNEPEKEVTMESLMAEIAELKAQNTKTKGALDKALKEKGDITKQYREVLTEAQQAKIDKETADEEQRKYVEGLEQYKAKSEAKNRYTLLGMDADMAEKAAEAEISGDMDALAMIQKQHTEALIKQKQTEWMGSRPPINAGTADGCQVTKEQFKKMDYKARVEFKGKYPELYKEYTK